MAESAGLPPGQSRVRPMVNPNGFVSVYADTPKGHASNYAIGSHPWTDHFFNWQHTPEIQNLAGTIDQMHGALENTRQQVKSTQAMLAGTAGRGAQGVTAQIIHDKLGQLHDDIQAKQASLKAGSDAINNFMPAFKASHDEIEAQWGQWWQNRANLNACKANEVNMTQAANGAKAQMLGLGQQLNQSFAADPTPVAIQAGAAGPVGADQADPTVAAVSDNDGKRNGELGTTAGTLSADPTTVPGMVVSGAHHGTADHLTTALGTPGATTINPGHHTTLAAHLTSATNAQGLSTSDASSQPTLASAGSATLAPPSTHTVGLAGAPSAVAPTTGPSLAPPVGLAGGGMSTVPASALVGGAGSASPAGAPGVVGTSGIAGAPGVASAPVTGTPGAKIGRAATTPEEGVGLVPPVVGPAGGGVGRRQDEERKRQSALVVPPTGAAGQTRAGATIRPGEAKIPVRDGVRDGLRGRRGQGATGGGVRRFDSKRRRRDPERTLQFLDEEAWEADDQGVGFVDAAPQREQTGKAASTPQTG